nr:MAG TPA: sheath tube [Caudoviricetes sp.]
MSTEYLHGVRVIEINNGSRPLRTASTAVIGLVATGEDADAATFPENRPVLISNLPDAIGKAGTKGTLAPALSAIYKQTNALTVVVRVPTSKEKNDNGADQDAKTIGAFENGRYSGAKALLAAHAELGVVPRILGAPGLDSQAVATELVSIAKKIRGFVYARAIGTTKEEAATYRANFSARELMLMWPDFTGFDEAAKKTNTIHATAVALGLRAKLDHEVGWHKTISNITVDGVTGLTVDIGFDITSTATDANYLNSKEVSTLVREQGFRIWGSRTCSDDALFTFESYTRTAQVIAETVARGHLWAIDKPLSPGLASDIIAGINASLRTLTSGGYLLGGETWYDDKVNNKDTLKAGQLSVSYNFTPVPPLENLNLRQSITDIYLIDFARRVEAAS